MAIPKKIINFLKKAGIKHEVIEHRTVYTAHDKAATLRVNPKIIGKTLVVKLDGAYGLVLIPANKNLDRVKLKKIANIERKRVDQKLIKTIGLATETWIKKGLKGAKVGAIPPFGSLWRLPTFIDRGLLSEQKIVINSGDYDWSIKISPANLKKLMPDLVIGSFVKSKPH